MKKNQHVISCLNIKNDQWHNSSITHNILKNKVVVLSVEDNEENYTGGGTCEGDTACTSSSMASTSIGEECAPTTAADTPRRLATVGVGASRFTTTLSAEIACDCLREAHLVPLTVFMLTLVPAVTSNPL
jgi:hypothetical protein